MENMTSPASNNKAPYRGVPARPNSRVQFVCVWWEGGGGGGGGEGETYIKNYQKQRYTFQIYVSENRVYHK